MEVTGLTQLLSWLGILTHRHDTHKVYLFGSALRGKAVADMDVCVVLGSDLASGRSLLKKIREADSCPPIHLIVFEETEEAYYGFLNQVHARRL
jgi:predicted nucleotidyltransferase